MRNALIASQTPLSLKWVKVLFSSRREDILLLFSIISQVWGFLAGGVGMRKGKRVRQIKKVSS